MNNKRLEIPEYDNNRNKMRKLYWSINGCLRYELGSGSGQYIWPDVDVNQEILMASYNYANLLET